MNTSDAECRVDQTYFDNIGDCHEDSRLQVYNFLYSNQHRVMSGQVCTDNTLYLKQPASIVTSVHNYCERRADNCILMDQLLCCEECSHP